MDTKTSPHILVVDDHREIRELLAQYLKQHGLRVMVAECVSGCDWSHYGHPWP